MQKLWSGAPHFLKVAVFPKVQQCSQSEGSFIFHGTAMGCAIGYFYGLGCYPRPRCSWPWAEFVVCAMRACRAGVARFGMPAQEWTPFKMKWTVFNASWNDSPQRPRLFLSPFIGLPASLEPNSDLFSLSSPTPVGIPTLIFSCLRSDFFPGPIFSVVGGHHAFKWGNKS